MQTQLVEHSLHGAVEHLTKQREKNFVNPYTTMQRYLSVNLGSDVDQRHALNACHFI